MICPNCDHECYRDEIDVGVGIIYGPWGCPCGWSEDPKYNQLDGPKKTKGGYTLDQYGGATPPGGYDVNHDPKRFEKVIRRDLKRIAGGFNETEDI